jgi:hypothetical protein
VLEARARPIGTDQRMAPGADHGDGRSSRASPRSMTRRLCRKFAACVEIAGRLQRVGAAGNRSPSGPARSDGPALSGLAEHSQPLIAKIRRSPRAFSAFVRRALVSQSTRTPAFSP